MENFFGSNKATGNEKPSILSSHENIDPEKELERINARIKQIENSDTAEGLDSDLQEEMEVLVAKRDNLMSTIQPKS